MNAAAQDISNARDAVVFWLWRDMAYGRRMLIAFGLIILGFLLQWYSGEIFSGVIPLAAGNALLLVRGYDNRVEFAGFDPSSQWQKVERDRLSQLKDFDRKIRRWDRSFIDISNGLGLATFLLLCLALFGLYVVFDLHYAYRNLRVIPVDMAILFLPHWFTGTRRILRLPGMLVKAEVLEKALDEVKPEAQGLRTEVLMLLKGKARLPEDIKVKIEPPDAPEEFLGLYGQVVINNVQGKSYPYFYVVLVARPGLDLKRFKGRVRPPKNLMAEYRRQDGVEVLVLRQRTTKRSGYHTSGETVRELLSFGLEQMRRLL